MRISNGSVNVSAPTFSFTWYFPGTTTGPASARSNSSMDGSSAIFEASGPRMFHTKRFSPASFGTRGSFFSSSSGCTVGAAPGPATVSAPSTGSAADGGGASVAPVLRLLYARMSLPRASWNESVTSPSGLSRSQKFTVTPSGGFLPASR